MFHNEIKPHAIYTFGSPRVGCKKFRQLYDYISKGRSFRIVNRHDIVPRTPPRISRFHHVGELHYIDPSGKMHKGILILRGDDKEHNGDCNPITSVNQLIEQNEIETVYVKTWEHENDVLGDCPGAIDLKDAEVVSDQLGIPFRVLNLMDFYHQHVVAPMVEGYASGITPNPDVLCNREMKFGALKDYAEK